MAMAPAAISARPAVTTSLEDVVAPDRPAARANGTVKPSAMPMTTSRTFSPAVKCFSTWGVEGIGVSEVQQDERDQSGNGLDEQDLPVGGDRSEDSGDDHAGEKEELDVETGEKVRDQSPDQPRSQKAVVEPLVRGERRRGGCKLGSQPESPTAIRLVPEEHFENQEVEVQSSHQAHGDVR